MTLVHTSSWHRPWRSAHIGWLVAPTCHPVCAHYKLQQYTNLLWLRFLPPEELTVIWGCCLSCFSEETLPLGDLCEVRKKYIWQNIFSKQNKNIQRKIWYQWYLTFLVDEHCFLAVVFSLVFEPKNKMLNMSLCIVRPIYLYLDHLWRLKNILWTKLFDKCSSHIGFNKMTYPL